MTSESPYSSNGGSGNGGSGYGDGGGPRSGHRPSGIAPVRAAVVIVIFVVAAIALVAVGTRPTVSGDAATVSTTTSTTTPAKTPPTTTTTTVPHSSVSVVVANATETNNLAGHYTTVLAGQGWALQTAVDATTTEATSTVYYQTGQQASAELIASTLGVQPADVQPYSAAVPVADSGAIDIVVVIGSNLVAAAST